MRVVIIGTYPPTACGIATFTCDLEAALRLNGVDVTVVPVSPDDERTGLAIRRDDEHSYAAVGHQINESGCDIVLIEHEFGIFGSNSGSNILGLIATLKVPYAVTLHTVLPRYSDEQANVIHELCRTAAAVTVFTHTARRLLLEQELVQARLLHVVAHGAPVELYQATPNEGARALFGVPEGVPIMSTFGLLSPNKGIESALDSMALLSDRHPDLHYVIAGRTHPEVYKIKGEDYRTSLHELSEQLGVSSRVTFVNRYLQLDELASLLAISNVVCTPYCGEDQTVSGVLTFALAAGCPVASTPYRYALDVLDGAGRFSDFGDNAALAESISNLLHDRIGALARAAARRIAAAMPWPVVGEATRKVLGVAIHESGPQVPKLAQHSDQIVSVSLPPTTHLEVLCDDTAIWQHAHYAIPRLEDGYCVDDAGRMLPIAAFLGEHTNDQRWKITIARLLAFLQSAARDGRGQMRNFMSCERRWLDEPHTGDHVGRAIWGLGELIAADAAFAADARDMMDLLAPAVSSSWPTRALAYASLGLAAASQRCPKFVDDLARISGAMSEWQPARSASWRWCEDRLTYDNARLPEALIRVGSCLQDDGMVERGLELLIWLDQLCLQETYYRFPGHRGVDDASQLLWSGDEQPLEATALADAHHAALAITDHKPSASAIDRAWTWFLGNNRAGLPLIDFSSGAGYDGLGRMHVNQNCGAESTIALHRCAITRSTALKATLVSSEP